MRRLASALLVGLAFAGLACADESASTASKRARARASAQPEPTAEPTPPPEPPKWLLLPWDTRLRVSPEQYAPALTLIPPRADGDTEPSPGRVVEVVGKADAEGRWWQLRTAATAQTREPHEVIEGLEFYALSLYVPAGTGKAVEGADLPDTPPPDDGLVRSMGVDAQPGTLAALFDAPVFPVQNGKQRPDALEQEWHIAPEARVYWPNGELAGTVREHHAFIEAGETKRAGRRELTCFPIRVGPPSKAPTELCFEPDAVEIAAPPVANPWADDEIWGGLMSDEEMAAIYGVGVGTIDDEDLTNDAVWGLVGEPEPEPEPEPDLEDLVEPAEPSPDDEDEFE